MPNPAVTAQRLASPDAPVGAVPLSPIPAVRGARPGRGKSRGLSGPLDSASLRRSPGAPAAREDFVSSQARQRLLDAQLKDVASRSEFYRPRLMTQPRTRWTLEALRQIPFTTRSELQDDQLLHPPFGSYLAMPREAIARVHRTNGTSGHALMIALSNEDIQDALNCGASCFQAAGVKPGQLIVHCLNYCMWSGGMTDHEALERAGAGVIPFGVGHSSELLRMIRRIRPDGIHCTPSYLSRLEQRLRDEFNLAPRDLGLKLGLFGGEPALADPAFRHRIESVWGFRAMDANYGMSEVLSMFAAECSARDGLHFLGGDLLHAELRSLNGDAVLDWQAGVRGELVLTHLRKHCQPLVRYRSSDVIEVVSVRPCPCGRISPRFRVIGRVDDMVVVRGINIFAAAVGRSIRAIPGMEIAEFRILVASQPPIEEFLVQIECPSATGNSCLQESVAKSMQRDLGVRPNLQFLPEGALPRTDGKTRRIERM